MMEHRRGTGVPIYSTAKCNEFLLFARFFLSPWPVVILSAKYTLLSSECSAKRQAKALAGAVYRLESGSTGVLDWNYYFREVIFVCLV